MNEPEYIKSWMEEELTPIMSADVDANQIFSLLEQEIYYGFNMRVVLSEMTDTERYAIRKFAERCFAERPKLNELKGKDV